MRQEGILKVTLHTTCYSTSDMIVETRINNETHYCTGMTNQGQIALTQQVRVDTKKMYQRFWNNQYRSICKEIGAAQIQIGHTFRKTFTTGTYVAIVTSTEIDTKTGKKMYHVHYEDDDAEDLFLEEFNGTTPEPINMTQKAWGRRQILEAQLNQAFDDTVPQEIRKARREWCIRKIKEEARRGSLRQN